MRKHKKRLCYILVLMMLVSMMPAMRTDAATKSSYAPYPNIEYAYSSGVNTGTIRYISQRTSSGYFHSQYWGNWASQAGIECFTSSISMALSYVGVNKTPKQILDAHDGITYYTGWGPTTLTPSVATGMNNYINGNGKYSPVIVHFTTGYSSGSHYVLLIGKVSSASYLVLDPASDSTWVLSTSDVKYQSINQVVQYYNASAVINNPVTPQKTISDGNYVIESCLNSYRVLGIAGESTESRANVELQSKNNSSFQTWSIRYIGGGYYTIQNVASGKYLDMSDGVRYPVSGRNIIQDRFNNYDNQKWEIRRVGDAYCLSPKCAPKQVIDVNSSNTNPGTNIQVWENFNKENQKFRLKIPVSINTGWRTENGCRYYYVNGTKVTGWRTIGGYRYYFSKSSAKLGQMLTGWQVIGGRTYYFSKASGKAGRMQTGWVKIGNYMYYFSKPSAKSGQMLTGWQSIGGHIYYFSKASGKAGRMLTGWQNISGHTYYFSRAAGKAGRMFTGWREINGHTYYFSRAKSTFGRMLRGYQTISGHRYYFNSAGQLVYRLY